MSHLNAVFGLGESPPGFNFLYFLVAADCERERRGLKHLDLHVIPGPAQGFRAVDTEYEPAEKEYRARRLVHAGAHLLPSLRRLHVHSEAGPQHAPGEVWPDWKGQPGVSGYSVLHDHAKAGRDLRRLHAPPWARRKVGEWAGAYRGKRKLVTVTLRETTYDAYRNSTRLAWLTLERRIRDAGYATVIVPDTERALMAEAPGFAPWAALDIELRAALYEVAHLNVGINQGAAELWNWLAGCRSLIVWQENRIGGWRDQEPLCTPDRRMVRLANDADPDALWQAFCEMELA